MNFKIPKIKIPSAKKNEAADEVSPADDAGNVLDELENGDFDGYAEQAEAAPSAPTFTVSEDQLRKLWAGEIAFGILSACVAVVIAFIG